MSSTVRSGALLLLEPPDTLVDVKLPFDEDDDIPILVVDDRIPVALDTVVDGRFRLDAVLGTGASGTVYAVTDLRGGRPLALKILHPSLVGSTEHVARFRREAHAASSLAHPNIVRVYDVRWSGGLLYMVMERLQGEVMLAGIVRKTLGTKQVVEVACQVLDGLSAAHAGGIIHRDVKPENILVTPAGAKLLDFGIVRFLRPERNGTFQTAQGLVVGTPHYMSPEQCSGFPATPSADIWSVGAVMFHALAGEPPFNDEHLARLLTRIVNDRAASLRSRRPDLPRAVIAAVDRALEPDPFDRWHTAAELRDALGSLWRKQGG